MQCQKYLKFPFVSGVYCARERLNHTKVRGHEFALKLKTERRSLQGTKSELWGLLEATGMEAPNSVETITLSTDSEQDYKLEGKEKKTCCLWPNHLNSPPPT